MPNISYIRNALLAITILLPCLLQTSCGMDVGHTNTSSHRRPSLPQKERHELDDEIEKMINAIRPPAYMTTLEEYKLRAEIASKNLPVIKKWLKEIFRGKVNIKTRLKLIDLETGSGTMKVSPLAAVLPYEVDIQLVEALVEQGADVNKGIDVNKLEKGPGQVIVSPLGLSVAYSSPDIIEWLLSNKADLKAGHYEDRPTAFLLLALLKDNPWPTPKDKTATLLVEKLIAAKRMQGKRKFKEGNTVLHELVLVKKKKSMEILLQILKNEFSKPLLECLYVANRKNRTPLELMLLEKDPDYSKSGMIVSLFDLMNKDFFREEVARLDEEDEEEQYGWRIVKMVSNSDGKSTPDRAFFLKQIAHEVSKV
ncbi:MAG: hypothetical protein AAFP88_01405 [Bacteroidota bacterium]